MLEIINLTCKTNLLVTWADTGLRYCDRHNTFDTAAAQLHPHSQRDTSHVRVGWDAARMGAAFTKVARRMAGAIAVSMAANCALSDVAPRVHSAAARCGVTEA